MNNVLAIVLFCHFILLVCIYSRVRLIHLAVKERIDADAGQKP